MKKQIPRIREWQKTESLIVRNPKMSLLLRYRSDPLGAVPPVTAAVPLANIRTPLAGASTRSMTKKHSCGAATGIVPYFCAHRTGGTDLPDSRLDAACWQRLTDVMGRLLSMTPERNEQ